MRASSGIFHGLGLYFHWDSIYLSRLFTMDLYKKWACLLSAYGPGSVRPILQDLSGFIFILFSCPLHPFWSVVIEKEGQLGWRLKNHRLTIQCSWVDGWNDWVDGDKVNGLTVEKAEVVKCTNIWQAVQKHLWRMTCRFLIGFYLESKRHFFFRALFL